MVSCDSCRFKLSRLHVVWIIVPKSSLGCTGDGGRHLSVHTMDAVKTVANLQARGSSIILNLESDKWETRANTLDTLPPEEVEQNVMLVLERVEDEDKSVRCAAVEALLRLNARFPRVMARHSKFIALKLQNNSRAIQLLALELLVELHPTELRRYLKKVRRLEIDKDPAVRGAARRVRVKCDIYDQAESDAALAVLRQQQQLELEQERRLAKAAAAAAAAAQRMTSYRVGGRVVQASGSGTASCPPLPPLPGTKPQNQLRDGRRSRRPPPRSGGDESRRAAAPLPAHSQDATTDHPLQQQLLPQLVPRPVAGHHRSRVQPMNKDGIPVWNIGRVEVSRRRAF